MTPPQTIQKQKELEGITPRRIGAYRLLDVWRGLASLAVVAFHWGEIAQRTTPALQNNTLYRVTNYGFLGVQVFFVISGFCIAAAAVATMARAHMAKAETVKAENGSAMAAAWGAYFVARVRRIYPTYWAALAGVLLFDSIASALAARGLIAGNIYTSVNLATEPIGRYAANITLTMFVLNQPAFLSVAWTLCYEVAFYVIVGVALGTALWGRVFYLRFYKNGETGLLLGFLHGVTLVSLAALLAMPTAVPFPLHLWPQFGIGVLVYDLLTHTAPRKKELWFATASIALLYVGYVVLRNWPIGGMMVWSRLQFTVAGVFAVLLLLLYRYDAIVMKSKVAQAMASVGLFSYSVYLTHTLTLRVFNQVVQKVAPSLLLSAHGLMFAVALLVATAFGYSFFLCFERPLLKRKKQAERVAPPPRKSETAAEQAA